MKEKWTSELLACDDCCYSYRSIHPKGLYELECQNCGNLSKHNKIYDTNQNDTKEKPLEDSKKLINYQTLALEDVCNGYYAGTQWESKEEEERTKEAFKSAYRLALRHLEGKVII